MARQSPPGRQDEQHSLQKSPPALQHQSVRLQNYDTLKAPTSGTGHTPRDVAAPQSQESTGLTLTSADSSYQVAPASQSQAQGGNDRFQFSGGFWNPYGSSNRQQAEGPLQVDPNSQQYVADVEATQGLPQSVARVSPPRYPSYIVQSQGGYVHAAERMSYTNYDPHDRHMFSHGSGAAEFPGWAAGETQGHSGGTAQGSQHTNDYRPVVQNSPMGSAGNQQPQSGSRNPQSVQSAQSNYVAPAQNYPGPGFYGPQAGFGAMSQNTASQSRNTQQSQGNYGPVGQKVPMNSQSAQQANRLYQSVAQNMPHMFAQGFRQKV